ncbi:MAG TPA: enoyl-CoA hydratase [Gammaproteobacteria bacterium]|nr:enoyl-CoA hydratase [Gammaproteobacteria bacterium]
MSQENVLVATDGRVGIVTMNRPKSLNALSQAFMDDLGDAVEALEADDGVGVIVITGGEKAFAAGADIKEFTEQDFPGVYRRDFPGGKGWKAVGDARKPTIAAVAGYALGGGCELAMSCDIILAADNARFGQPEIKLGVIPGAGGTQRLPRAIGKAKAMEMCLTGRMIDAAEAERLGLVSRVVPAESLMAEAMETARIIGGHSLPAVMMAKEAVNRAFEAPLHEGLRFESRLFQATFATEDHLEGANAFIEKRAPNFRHR